MCFIKFEDMSEEERDNFQFLAEVMDADRKLHGEILTNAASIKTKKKSRRTGASVLSTIVGTMRGIGWRAATTAGNVHLPVQPSAQQLTLSRSDLWYLLSLPTHTCCSVDCSHAEDRTGC